MENFELYKAKKQNRYVEGYIELIQQEKRQISTLIDLITLLYLSQKSLVFFSRFPSNKIIIFHKN